MRKFLPVLFIAVIILSFFWQFLAKGLFPIPADTIVGLYFPFRDFYAKEYPRGIPFKNFQITDPIRQLYPWKTLVIEAEKKLQLPLWNPYTFAGGPLLANFQSGVFYPFNILFFILPSIFSWSFLILLQPLLSGLFLFFFLDNLKVDKKAALVGSLTFAFCGFAISWMEWGNIIHTGLWLPLILLSIDKIIKQRAKQFSIFSFSFNPELKSEGQFSVWYIVFLLSLIFSFFAGHLQIFLYVFLISLSYLAFRWFENGKPARLLKPFFISAVLFIVLTAVQWIPTLQFISHSARALDQADWHIAGWFIPWQNIVQFLVPDFFGNPATLNYFGIFNYGEFIGYVGMLSLIMAILSIFRKDKTTFFFLLLLVLGFIFAFPSIISKIPYKFSFPFISTAQPTRLMFVIDFCLSVLAALGLDFWLKTKEKPKVVLVIGALLLIFGALWLFVFSFSKNFFVPLDLEVVKRNLVFPTVLFLIVSAILVLGSLFKRMQGARTIRLIVYCLIIIMIADLFRFGLKYTTFAKSKYLYPNTQTIKFLQNNIGNFRVMSTDSRIFPPNFSVMYKLQSIDGYDPLFLQRYAELIAANERGVPNINPPLGFNRIITPQNYRSGIINLLGVKYILSLSEINNKQFKKVFSEGETFVYENRKVLLRAFFVSNLLFANNKQTAIEELYSLQKDLRTNAVVETDKISSREWSWLKADARIVKYSENEVIINTKNPGDGFLILTDSYYPSWHAIVDGKETQIYLTDYNFRGIIVPEGNHSIVFYNSLF